MTSMIPLVLSVILRLQNPVALPVEVYIPNNAFAGEVRLKQSAVSSAVIKYKYLDAMKALGFYEADSPDETVNARNATIRFQSDNNLTADGVQGSRFKSAMIKRLMINGSYAYPDSILKPAAEGYWITINKSKKILTLYQGTSVVKKYPVAIGRSAFSTPEGKFKVVIKVKNPVWINPETKEQIKGGSGRNPLGYRWMGLSVGKGYKYGIHGNNKPYSIGQEISKGCIRMINSDVSEIYDKIPKGTPVWIGKEGTLKKWGVVQNSFY